MIVCLKPERVFPAPQLRQDKGRRQGDSQRNERSTKEQSPPTAWPRKKASLNSGPVCIPGLLHEGGEHVEAQVEKLLRCGSTSSERNQEYPRPSSNHTTQPHERLRVPRPRRTQGKAEKQQSRKHQSQGNAREVEHVAASNGKRVATQPARSSRQPWSVCARASRSSRRQPAMWRQRREAVKPGSGHIHEVSGCSNLCTIAQAQQLEAPVSMLVALRYLPPHLAFKPGKASSESAAPDRRRHCA